MLTIDVARQVLMDDPEIQAGFASYKGQPAIWMKDQVPFDTSEFWTLSNDDQYPRADLALTTQYMPERQVMGQFAVNLWAKVVEADAMLKRIIDVLDGALLLSDEGRDSLQWAGTTDGNYDDVYAHFMITFNLVRMTTGMTTTPAADPTKVLYRWTEENIEDAMVNPDSWLPQRDTFPAIFWRPTNEQAYQHWPAHVEFEGTFVAHILHPDQQTRANMVRKLFVLLAKIRGMRIAFPDLRPYLRLDENGIAYDSNRDPLRAGQVQLSSVLYVIPRETLSVPPLENIEYAVTASIAVG